MDYESVATVTQVAALLFFIALFMSPTDIKTGDIPVDEVIKVLVLIVLVAVVCVVLVLKVRDYALWFGPAYLLAIAASVLGR